MANTFCRRLITRQRQLASLLTPTTSQVGLTSTLTSTVTLNERLRVQAVPLRAKKASKSWMDLRKTNAFVDFKRVRCYAGDGGNGSVHLASVFKEEFAGPDGGDGGHGGHVIFRGNGTQLLLKRPHAVLSASAP